MVQGTHLGKHASNAIRMFFFLCWRAEERNSLTLFQPPRAAPLMKEAGLPVYFLTQLIISCPVMHPIITSLTFKEFHKVAVSHHQLSKPMLLWFYWTLCWKQMTSSRMLILEPWGGCVQILLDQPMYPALRTIHPPFWGVPKLFKLPYQR